MSTKRDAGLVLRPPPLDGATAAWIFDLCGQLQSALLDVHGDEMDAYWTSAESGQPCYRPRRPSTAPGTKLSRKP
jgi:hypothetical protein